MLRAAGGVLIVAMALVACGPAPAPQAPTNAKKESPAQRVVYTDAGELTRYSQDEPRRALWTVRWTKAKLDAMQGESAGGEMERVSGEIFEGGRAEIGRAHV